MRLGDGRHDADLGLPDRAEAGDLAGSTHPHLEHQDLDVIWCAEHGDRQPLLVVEAAGVGRHTSPGADCGNREVLRARLADAARDPDDGGGQLAPRPRRQIEQRLTRVRDLDDRDADRRICSPAGERRAGTGAAASPRNS